MCVPLQLHDKLARSAYTKHTGSYPAQILYAWHRALYGGRDKGNARGRGRLHMPSSVIHNVRWPHIQHTGGFLQTPEVQQSCGGIFSTVQCWCERSCLQLVLWYMREAVLVIPQSPRRITGKHQKWTNRQDNTMWEYEFYCRAQPEGWYLLLSRCNVLHL